MICFIILLLMGFFSNNTSAINPHYRLSMSPSGKPFFKVGETLKLNCRLLPTDAKIFPLRISVPISSGQIEVRMSLVEEPNNLTVTIKSLETNDTGWYNCEASDRTAPMFKSIYVTVQQQYTADCPESTFFSCGQRLCIPKRYVCDGFTDCPNDNDENLDICGSNPCDNKISCEDGRCIPKQYCCIRSEDSNCLINNLVPCCQHYLDQLDSKKPVTDMKFNDNLIRSTIYTIVSCAIAVFFFMAILIVAVYRIHLRRSLFNARQSQQTVNSFAANQQRNNDHYLYNDTTNEMFEPIDQNDFDLSLRQYDTDDMMLSISQFPKPPLYSEALNHPIMPYNEPPPPYSPNITHSSVLSPESEGTSNSETSEESNHVLVIPMNPSQGCEELTNNLDLQSTNT